MNARIARDLRDVSVQRAGLLEVVNEDVARAEQRSYPTSRCPHPLLSALECASVPNGVTGGARMRLNQRGVLDPPPLTASRRSAAGRPLITKNA